MGVRLNTDTELVRAIKEGLKKKDGYCPCRIERIEAYKCICEEFRAQIADPDFEGYCHCMLYYKYKDTTGKDKKMEVIKVTNDNFETVVLQTDKPVLIDFYATWCGPCRMVSPLVDEIAEENSDYQICKVDVDEVPELAQKFGVMSIPTLVVLKNGKVVAQNVGALPKNSILDMLKQA